VPLAAIGGECMDYNARSRRKPTGKIKEETQTQSKLMRVYNTPKLNIRSLPDIKSSIVRVHNHGDSFKVEIMESNPEWAKVENGYVMTKFLKEA
jgi:uncharacterized protein YgiM (DUF1202 family)